MLMSEGATGISCFTPSGEPVSCATQFVAPQDSSFGPVCVTYRLMPATMVLVAYESTPNPSVLFCTFLVSRLCVVGCTVVRVPSQFGAVTFAPPDSSE